jgi:hypothetical protein
LVVGRWSAQAANDRAELLMAAEAGFPASALIRNAHDIADKLHGK